MLKTFLIISTFSAVLVNAELGEVFDSFFERRCSKGGNSNAYSELVSAFIRARICVENNIARSTNETETFKVICSVLSDKIYKCVEDVTEKLVPCLEPEENFLPDFFIASFNNTLDQQCKDNGKSFLEQRTNLKYANCSVPSGTMGSIILETCIPKLRMAEAFIKTDFVLTQDDLCSDIETMKDCFLDVFEEKCENDTYTQFIETIYNPVLTWCSQENTNSY